LKIRAPGFCRTIPKDCILKAYHNDIGAFQFRWGAERRALPADQCQSCIALPYLPVSRFSRNQWANPQIDFQLISPFPGTNVALKLLILDGSAWQTT
jgi:hypothetical protein